MKRCLALLLAVLLLASAAACSKPEAPSQVPDTGGEETGSSGGNTGNGSGDSSDSGSSDGNSSGDSSGSSDGNSSGDSSGSASGNNGNSSSGDGGSGGSASGGNGGDSGGGDHPQLGDNITVLERDAQGNILKTEERLDNGTKIHRTYHAAGALQKEERWEATGLHLVTELDDRGRVEAEIRDDTDGTRTATAYTYHANGTLASESMLSSAGSSRNAYYNEQGLLIKEETRAGLGDKRTRELTYHANGKVATEQISISGGTTQKTTYNEAGIPVHFIEKNADSSKTEITYYKNGSRKTEVITDRYGNVETWTYSADGRSASGTSSLGSYSVTYHDNGNTATRRFDAAPEAKLNFTYEEYAYDREGTLLTHTKMQTNDTLCVSTYHSDGSHTTVFTYAEGGGHTEYWYGNNLLGGLDSDGRPWGVKVPGADYSGLSGGGSTGRS